MLFRISSAMFLFVCFSLPAQAVSLPPISSHSATENNIIKVGSGCGWFAIFQCAKSYKGARRANRSITRRIVNTNRVPGWRNGWYCGIKGHYPKSQARRVARRKGGYIKYGCPPF